MNGEIRVAVLSDQAFIAEALVAALSRPPSPLVARAAADAAACVAGGEVDVVLLDASGAVGPAVLQFRAALPGARVVMFGLLRDEDVLSFVEAGVAGYVLREHTLAELIQTVHAVHEGGQACPPALVPSVLARIRELAASPGRQETGPAGRLTPREDEILRLVAAGLSNKEIAERLEITLWTVKNHVHNLLEKLQVHRRRDAIQHAVRQGMLRPAASA